MTDVNPSVICTCMFCCYSVEQWQCGVYWGIQSVWCDANTLPARLGYLSRGTGQTRQMFLFSIRHSIAWITANL